MTRRTRIAYDALTPAHGRGSDDGARRAIGKTAAEALEQQAAELGIHSRDCREGTAETIEIFSVGCAPCEVLLRDFAAWETRYDGPPEYDGEAWDETFGYRRR